MKKFKELESGKDYIAIGSDGKEYEGKAQYFENIGMIFFCCHPQEIKLIEFKEISAE